MSKWWEMRKIHQVKRKFKTEWESSYPVKHIFSDPFSFSYLSCTGFQFFLMPKPTGFSANLQVFYLGLLGLRGLQEGLLLVKSTLSEHPIFY